ncbi:uncharacterized protein N7487_000564 [Penicillium crustosum]|uniref:uncharacterized protein n=1 Tax=Penicillium crustosum TaxID=36656 RepID=UPI00238FE072|nr:uncharacterized protein N7487_000564 [Penicillium crustosum]KAJ5417014.1 hypothetical protein N7487_000564 [Penicillium crustosum]
MTRSLDDINLDNQTLDHLFEFDLTTFGSVYPQPFRARRSPTVADTSTARAYQPRYNPYEELLTPIGGHFVPTAPPTHRRPNQNIQYHTVSDNDPRALAIPFHGSAEYFSRTAPLVASPLQYPQPNQNTAQYFTVNSNDPQAPATAFDSPRDSSACTASPVPSPLGQVQPQQGPSRSEVIALGALSNGSTNDKAPRSPNHGHEQANSNNDIRCDWPGCSYHGTFTKKGSLKRHRDEQHTSPRSFPCPLCENAYSRKSHLNDHQLKAHGIRVYVQ